MFVFWGPIDVGFNCSEDSDIIFVDMLAGMDPFGPGVVGTYATGVLEADAEGCGFFIVRKGKH